MSFMYIPYSSILVRDWLLIFRPIWPVPRPSFRNSRVFFDCTTVYDGQDAAMTPWIDQTGEAWRYGRDRRLAAPQ